MFRVWRECDAADSTDSTGEIVAREIAFQNGFAVPQDDNPVQVPDPLVLDRAIKLRVEIAREASPFWGDGIPADSLGRSVCGRWHLLPPAEQSLAALARDV